MQTTTEIKKLKRVSEMSDSYISQLLKMPVGKQKKNKIEIEIHK